MQAAPYILMAAGTAASVAADRNAAKERRGIINRSMEQNQKVQDAAADRVVQEGQHFGQQRQQDIAAAEQSAIAQALRDVGGNDQGAGAALIDTAGDAGAVSGDFIKAKADRAISEGNRMTAVARELAKVRAPGQLLNTEGIRRAGLMGDIGSAAGSNRNRAQAAMLDAQGVEPAGWGQLGKLAATIGSAWAGGGLSAAPAAAGVGASSAWDSMDSPAGSDAAQFNKYRIPFRG